MTTAAQRAAYQYKYTEPHPSVTKAVPLSTGRGGVGNRTTVCPKTTSLGPTATGPPSRSPIVSPSLNARRFSSGRGGAGNVKDKNQIAALGEPTVYELEREARHDHEDAIRADKRVWHYGRGGEGNMIDQTKTGQKGKATVRAGIVSERRSSNESVISSGSSVMSDLASRTQQKSSRASSFTDKIAAKLGARKGASKERAAEQQ